MKNKGFTLTELIIYIGVVSLVVIAVIGFLLDILDDRTKQSSLSEVDYNGVFVLDKIDYHTKRAESINTSQSQFDTRLGKLVLNLKGGSTTTFDTYDDQVNLGGNTVTTTKLKIKNSTSSPVDITSKRINVKKITIKDLSNNKADTIKVILKLERLNPTNNKYHEAEEKWQTSYTIKKRQ